MMKQILDQANKGYQNAAIIGGILDLSPYYDELGQYVASEVGGDALASLIVSEIIEGTAGMSDAQIADQAVDRIDATAAGFASNIH